MIKPLYEVACSFPRSVAFPSFQSLGLEESFNKLSRVAVNNTSTSLSYKT